MLDLVFYAGWICCGKIDFVYDGDDFEVVFKCDIDVCDGLRLYALRSVYDEQRTLAAS